MHNLKYDLIKIGKYLLILTTSILLSGIGFLIIDKTRLFIEPLSYLLAYIFGAISVCIVVELKRKIKL